MHGDVVRVSSHHSRRHTCGVAGSDVGEVRTRSSHQVIRHDFGRHDLVHDLLIGGNEKNFLAGDVVPLRQVRIVELDGLHHSVGHLRSAGVHDAPGFRCRSGRDTVLLHPGKAARRRRRDIIQQVALPARPGHQRLHVRRTVCIQLRRQVFKARPADDGRRILLGQLLLRDVNHVHHRGLRRVSENGSHVLVVGGLPLVVGWLFHEVAIGVLGLLADVKAEVHDRAAGEARVIEADVSRPACDRRDERELLDVAQPVDGANGHHPAGELVVTGVVVDLVRAVRDVRCGKARLPQLIHVVGRLDAKLEADLFVRREERFHAVAEKLGRTEAAVQRFCCCAASADAAGHLCGMMRGHVDR